MVSTSEWAVLSTQGLKGCFTIIVCTSIAYKLCTALILCLKKAIVLRNKNQWRNDTVQSL